MFLRKPNGYLHEICICKQEDKVFKGLRLKKSAAVTLADGTIIKCQFTYFPYYV